MGNLACKASTNSWNAARQQLGSDPINFLCSVQQKKSIIGNCNHVYWVPTRRSGSCKRYVWVFLRVSWRCSVCWWLSFRGKGFTALRSSSPDEDKMKMLICPNHFQQCCIAPKWSKCSKKYNGKYRAKPVLVYPKVDWFLVAWLSNHFGMVIFPLFVASPWKSHWSFWLTLLLVDRSPSLGEVRPWLKPPWRSAPTAWPQIEQSLTIEGVWGQRLRSSWGSPILGDAIPLGHLSAVASSSSLSCHKVAKNAAQALAR